MPNSIQLFNIHCAQASCSCTITVPLVIAVILTGVMSLTGVCITCRMSSVSPKPLTARGRSSKSFSLGMVGTHLVSLQDPRIVAIKVGLSLRVILEPKWRSSCINDFLPKAEAMHRCDTKKSVGVVRRWCILRRALRSMRRTGKRRKLEKKDYPKTAKVRKVNTDMEHGH